MHGKNISAGIIINLITFSLLLAGCNNNAEQSSLPYLPEEMAKFKVKSQEVCDLLSIEKASQASGLPITVQIPQDFIPLPACTYAGSQKRDDRYFNLVIAGGSFEDLAERKQAELRNGNQKVIAYDEIQKGAFLSLSEVNQSSFEFMFNGKIARIVALDRSLDGEILVAIGAALLDVPYHQK